MELNDQLAVTLTVAQLRDLVKQEVRAAVAPSESDVMTAAQTAKLLGVTERSIATYVAKHGLPASKLPNEWRFFRSEVIAWMKGRK